MSTTDTTKQAAPLGCSGCRSTEGPFDLTTGFCEDCDPEAKLLSALEDGGWLDDNARRLIDAYAAVVLRRAGAGVAR
ncbi:hypothetical protein [Streptomyces griseorubiginosus]|uniref:hypothetical protein n=1 Tax=Streptomyces griseorubiginosus TaxID=67304 RepID=UPI003329D035